MKELRQEMNKLKEFISSFKTKIENIYASQYSSEFGEVFELYTTLENCFELFDSHQTSDLNKFWIPDDLFTPEISSDDSISSLYDNLEHLKKLYEFLTQFKADLENLPEVVPVEPKQIFKKRQPKKTQPFRLPSEMFRDCSGVETAPEIIIGIDHPEPVTVAESRSSIDRNLLGNDYLPFNVAIPDERRIDEVLLKQPSTSNVKSINASECGSPEINRHIPSEGVSSIINAHSINVESEIQSLPHIMQPQLIPEVVVTELTESEIHNLPYIMQPQPISEEAATEFTDIDQNALEIMQELSQQRSLRIKTMNRLRDSTSSNNTEYVEITRLSPVPLKKTKFRKIRNQFLLLPQDIKKYRIAPHYSNFQLNVHAQAVINAVLKVRSTIRPQIIQASIQQNVVDEIQTQFGVIQLSQSHIEVQALRSNQTHLEKSSDIPHITTQPHHQSEIQLSTMDYNPDQPSIRVVPLQSLQKSPMPVIGSIVEPGTEKEKVPDASYALFEAVLQNQNTNKNATPKRMELSDTGKKSLRQVSEADMIKYLERGQYVTLCVLREIRQKYSTSNRITIKTIQAHFGIDRIGYCKLIRTAIDLQCHDLIRIVKNGNEISEIEIFEK